MSPGLIDSRGGKLSFAGVTIDNVPRWALGLVALLIAAVTGFTIYWTTIRQPQRELVTLKEANEALQADLQEYNAHLGEPPEAQAVLMDDARGHLVVQRFADGCVLLERRAQTMRRAKLVVDLARDRHTPHAAARWFTLPVVEAQGRCLNQHPGGFNTWYGARQGCVVEVWRRWADGCQHFQYFDACHGSWDQQIHWTQCVH